MALDKVIDSAQLDANLTAVADAIRTKGGTTEALSFPSGFVSAVEGIQAGGGGDDVLESILDRTIVDFSNSKITKLSNYAFYKCASLKTVNIPNVTECEGNLTFGDCTALESISAPSLKSAYQSTFQNTGIIELNLPSFTYSSSFLAQNCKKLERVILPEMPSFGGFSVFSGCPALTHIYAPKATSLAYGFAESCTSLEKIDLPSLGKIGPYSFKKCSKLQTVILRNPSLVTLENVNAFSNTPLESGTGYFYVHRTLADGSDGVATYQVATNWSTFANQFRAIEDYPEICGEVSA